MPKRLALEGGSAEAVAGGRNAANKKVAKPKGAGGMVCKYCGKPKYRTAQAQPIGVVGLDGRMATKGGFHEWCDNPNCDTNVGADVRLERPPYEPSGNEEGA